MTEDELVQAAAQVEKLSDTLEADLNALLDFIAERRPLRDEPRALDLIDHYQEAANAATDLYCHLKKIQAHENAQKEAHKEPFFPVGERPGKGRSDEDDAPVGDEGT
jgi:hypothetical protein